MFCPNTSFAHTRLRFTNQLVLGAGAGDERVRVAEGKGGLLSSGPLRLQSYRPNAATEQSNDADVFCLMPVSSHEEVVRDGDILAIWSKFRGGHCILTESKPLGAGDRLTGMVRSLMGTQRPVDPSILGVHCVPSDVGEACWFVITTDPNPGRFSIRWFCKPCQQKNGPGDKFCPRCQATRPPSNGLILRLGQRVHLIPVTSPLHTLQLGTENGVVAGPIGSTEDAVTATFVLQGIPPLPKAEAASNASPGFGLSEFKFLKYQKNAAPVWG